MDYDFPTAFSLWGPEEREAIARVLASGRFTMGKEVEAFEHEFAAYHGRKHAIMVNSGSSANLLAVAALFNKEIDPLERGAIMPSAVVPAIAWSTSYAPLVQHGMNLVLVDVDETWNAPVPRWLPRTNLRLVVVVPILGTPAYAAEWKEAADKTGAYMIEDCCESFGARAPDGKLCGTTGIMATFSFFYSHQISAIEGGMVLTDDDDCARTCRILRAHGWTRDVDPPKTFADEYDFTHFGYNIRPLELHAAIAREQLCKQLKFQGQRLMNAARFRGLTLATLPIRLPKIYGAPNPFGLHFLCESGEARAELVAEMRGAGIDCRLPTGGSFRRHKYGERWRDFLTPNADHIHDCGLFCGNAPFDINDKIERAASVIARVAIRRRERATA